MATGDRQQQLDDDGQSQELQSALVSGMHLPYIPGPFQPSQMMMAPTPITSSQLPGPASSHPHLVQPPLSSYQQIHQQQMLQLEQQLKVFWSEQYNEILQISSTSDFKNHNLPLARIKKIMKADEDVRMIAAEAPVLFARACEMFILELTYRSWAQTEENKRRTLLKNDIAGAITRTESFDFLMDIVPREEVKDEVITPMPRGGPNDALPFYYPTPQFGSLGMEGCRPEVDQAFMHGHQAQPFLPQQFWEQQQQTATTQQLQHPSEGIDHDHDSGNIQP